MLYVHFTQFLKVSFAIYTLGDPDTIIESMIYAQDTWLCVSKVDGALSHNNISYGYLQQHMNRIST